MAATPGPKSLVIKVEIKTTDTAEVKSGPALVDCGATGQFMDHDYVEHVLEPSQDFGVKI